ncbi:MAG TPA: hypothetical protein VJ206_07265 [bacterium]|nr:hypothetical protein [bacterium]
MREDVLSRAQCLSDHELVARVKLLAQHEREATVALIAHLAVLDERNLYLGEGCPSLFTYCTQILHLAEHAAYNRIEAARAARQFPIILEMLADGSVTLTTVRLLAPHLTSANHDDLLASARHRSKRQVEELVAQLHPQPPTPSSIRRLPMPKHEPSWETTRLDAPSGVQAGRTMDLGPSLPTPPARPVVVEPLGSRRYRVQFTASTETCDKLRLAQDLLRHQIPDGDLGEIVDRAVTLLIETLARQKFAATDRPRERPGSGNGGPGSGARHIPAEVKRTVWVRDGGQCAFVARNGRRCNERGVLEFHHVVPYGAGGDATPANIQLRCRAHNGYEATLYFGGADSPVVPPSHVRPTMLRVARNEMPPSARAGPG